MESKDKAAGAPDTIRTYDQRLRKSSVSARSDEEIAQVSGIVRDSASPLADPGSPRAKSVRGPHVRVELRKVYVSARGARLTKHSAYIAAAKELIARACDCSRGDDDCEASQCYCSATVCRFHLRHEELEDMTGMGDMQPVGVGMTYYVKVLPRLVRFLKFVDSRRNPWTQNCSG